MRLPKLSGISRLAIIGVLFLTAVVVVNTSATDEAYGVPTRTWWVATSGTPDGTASSCADPDAVGTTHAAIQSVLDQADDDDTVRLCAGTYAIGTTLTVDEDVTLVGAGATATILDGGSATRIMSITSTVSAGTGVTIDSIQFRNGRVSGHLVNGGAIDAHPNAKLTITDSLFRGNRSMGHHGGAVAMIAIAGGANTGSLHIEGSTFVDNHANYDGGAVNTTGMTNSDPTITNSTFAENTAGREGGAVNATFGETQVSFSTFLDNRSVRNGAAVYKAVLSNSLIASSEPAPSPQCHGHSPGELTDNVSTDASCIGTGGLVRTAADLELTFLAPWGGATPTVAIGSGSDAIGAVAANCPTTDQRGVNRGGPSCDAGAFEFESVPGAAVLTPNRLNLRVVEGQPIATYTLPVASGLTSPTYRLATEISPALPAGVSLSPTTGRLSGTPTQTVTASAFVITASDSQGAVANLRIDVDACTLTQDLTGVYRISSRSDLAAFRDGLCGWDADYRLMSHIAWNGPWTGDGPGGVAFTGTFDGDGHAITGLVITDGGLSAFIASAIDATVSALTFSADVTGGYSSAGLVGYSDRTHLLDVHGSVTFSGGSRGAGCTGGLAGEFYDNGTITDSSVTGTIDDPAGNWVGGLVGCAGPAIIARSSFVGDVTGRDFVGGLAGYTGDAKVVDSFAAGHVTGSAQVGGLVGEQWDGGPGADPIAVSNSYASVDLHGGTTAVGGLVGEGESTAIEASFWEAGRATAGAMTAIGAARDLGSTPTGSAATNPADLRSRAFLDAAGWAIVDGWANPATTSAVWGVCELMGRPFHLHRHATDPCVAAPPAPPAPPVPPAPQLPISLIAITGQPTQPAGSGTPSGSGETPGTTVPSTTTPTTVAPGSGGAPAPNPNPVLSAGELATFVDGRPVAATTTWGPNGFLVVRIGDTQVGLGFESGLALTGPRGRLRQGRPVPIALGGLKPGSSVIATLFSSPIRLGQMTAGPDGTVTETLMVPETAPAGAHRIRLEVTDSAGRAISVWLGVDIDPAEMQLPATGSSAPVAPALVLVLVGAALLGGARRRRPTSLR